MTVASRDPIGKSQTRSCPETQPCSERAGRRHATSDRLLRQRPLWRMTYLSLSTRRSHGLPLTSVPRFLLHKVVCKLAEASLPRPARRQRATGPHSEGLKNTSRCNFRTRLPASPEPLSSPKPHTQLNRGPDHCGHRPEQLRPRQHRGGDASLILHALDGPQQAEPTRRIDAPPLSV
jgi:hypothetical protein